MIKKIATSRRTVTLTGNNALSVSGPKRHDFENKSNEGGTWSSRWEPRKSYSSRLLGIGLLLREFPRKSSRSRGHGEATI